MTKFILTTCVIPDPLVVVPRHLTELSLNVALFTIIGERSVRHAEKVYGGDCAGNGEGRRQGRAGSRLSRAMRVSVAGNGDGGFICPRMGALRWETRRICHVQMKNGCKTWPRPLIGALHGGKAVAVLAGAKWQSYGRPHQ